MSNKEKGKYGEKLAAEFLIKHGCKIIETNYRYSKYGEIDIIAQDGQDLCFIEVKTRTTDKFGTPFEAITKTKLLKYLECIKNYTQNINIKYKKCRIDAISILLNEKNNPKIEHLKNIEF